MLVNETKVCSLITYQKKGLLESISLVWVTGLDNSKQFYLLSVYKAGKKTSP